MRVGIVETFGLQSEGESHAECAGEAAEAGQVGLAGEDGELLAGAPLRHPPPGGQGVLQAGVTAGQALRTAGPDRVTPGLAVQGGAAAHPD